MKETKRIVPLKEKIAVGLPRGADTGYRFEWIESLFKMFGRSPCNYRMVSAAKVHHLARNAIIKDFLATDMNYLLFIDSDMIWEPNSLDLAYQLMQHPMVDIVTGIYFTKGEPHLPVIKKLNLKAGCYNIFIEWGNEPFEVDGAGMGFMLIPRYVLEKMKQPICTWDGGFSEDLNFCLKAKKDFGFRIWAHPRIKLGHIGSKIITSFDWVQQFKPGMKAYIREAMYNTTNYLKEEFPNWRETLGIHPLDFKNINTKEYWDRIYKAEGGLKTWRDYPGKYGFVSKKLLKDLPETAKVLELGCGVGVFAALLQKDHPKFEMFGIDISEYAIDCLKSLKIGGEVAKIPPINQPDKSWDTVVGLELMEHLDEKPREELVRETYRVLKPGGVAVFSSPDNIMPPEELPEHRIMFSRKTYKKLFRKAFKDVRVFSHKAQVSTHTGFGEAPFLIAVCKKEK